MVGIVIQGPTTFIKKVVDFYSGEAIQDKAKVVYSTWEDSNKEDLEYIKNSPIDLVLSPLPEFNGHLNINYQLKSTYEGIKFLESKGVSTIIKVRSDVTWAGVDGLFDYFRNKRISFLNINNRVKHELGKWEDYYLDYLHTHQDFPSDHVIAGNIHYLKTTFNLQITEENNIPPESIILHSYLKNFSTSTSFELNNLVKSGVDLFGHKAISQNNDIRWLKHNWDLIKIAQNPNEKFINSL